MSHQHAQFDYRVRIYFCVVCGPCLQFLVEYEEDDEETLITVHRQVVHPPEMTFDEEMRPQ